MTRIAVGALLFVGVVCVDAWAAEPGSPVVSTSLAAGGDDHTLACYYFPNYHVDPRNEAWHGKGWTEWELVKQAGPRFEGHQQPKVPAWGYTDEADPKQMAQKIDAAANAGIDVFIFDWYYYNDGLFLERGLERGFMPAANASRMKFAPCGPTTTGRTSIPNARTRRRCSCPG
ncbi:MAG TPA: glycoside hydrolase family 99-like domain-containing protein [Phycisphaerae bacterium]|nr:glycoside hydrolase family 99-like domain-containing protein [Phycisphaerae bacterium]